MHYSGITVEPDSQIKQGRDHRQGTVGGGLGGVEGEHRQDGFRCAEGVGEELVFGAFFELAAADGGEDGGVWGHEEGVSPGNGKEMVEIWMRLSRVCWWESWDWHDGR